MADINQTTTVTLTVNGKQAEQKLQNLTKRAEQLHQQMEQALRAGDNKTYNKLNKELQKVNREAERIQATAVNVNKVLRNINGASLGDLEKTLKILQREFRQTEQDSPRFSQLSEAIRNVKTQIQQVKDETNAAKQTLQDTGQQPTFFSRISKGFDTIRSAINKVVGAYQTLLAAVTPYADMEEQMAETRKFTGMTTEEVQELNEAFRQMDTRTSREQLNQLAQEAGRLGKSTKEEVLQYVEAADIIHVALNDLGEDATETVYKLASIFHVDQDLGTRDAMLAVGSAVNTLSQNSIVSSNFLVEFSQRMAGVGATAKLSVPDILAYGSTLSSAGMQVEQSSSALGRLAMKLFQDPAKMAKAAGLDVKQFTDTLARDTNEAMLMFLERIHELGAKDGLTVLAPMFKEMGANGVGLTNVLTSLADNIDMVRAQQQAASKAFEEANSVLEEFSIGNNTAKARLEKHRNELHEVAVALGEKLMPVMDGVIKGTTAFIKVITTLGKFLKDYGAYTLTVVAAIAVYTAVVKASAIAEGIHTAAIKIKTATLEAARRAQLAFNAAAKANPWGLIAAAIAAVVAALAVYKLKLKELTAEQKLDADVKKQVIRQYGEEKGKIDALNKAVHDETRSLADRRKALNELRAIVPGYHAELTEEGKLINDNKDAIDRYCEALYQQIMLQAYQERLQKQYKRRVELEMQKDELTAQEEQAQSNLQNVSYTPRAAVAGSVAVTDATVWQDRLKRTQRELEKNEKEAAEVDALITHIEKKIRSIDGIDNILGARSSSPASSLGARSSSPASESSNTQSQDTWRKQQLALNEIYYQTALYDHKEYTRRRLEIERDYQRDRMQAAEEGSTEYLQAQAAYLKADADLRQTAADQEKKADQQHTQQAIDEENRRYQNTQRSLRQSYIDGETDTVAYHAAMETAELNHLRALANIYKEGSEERLRAQQAYEEASLKAQEKHAEESRQMAAKLKADQEEQLAGAMQNTVSAMSGIFSQLSSYIDAETQLQAADIENRYDREIQAAGNNAERVTALEKQKQAEIAKIKSEASEKNFKMNIFTALAEGSMAAVAAFKAGWEVGGLAGSILGPLFMALSLATTGVQIAAMKKQQQAAAATGYAEGGYTRRGRKYEPAGIVHAGEWVASQALLQNPQAAAVIAALDQAQRTNTIGSLGARSSSPASIGTPATLGAAVVQRSSPATIGTPATLGAAVVQRSSPATIDPSLALTLKKLNRRLSEPFVTVNTIEGDRGIKRAQDRYARLTKGR